MKYILSYKQPHNHYIDIEFIADVHTKELIVQLPAWRPGRYELGNFAKNIQKWQVTNETGDVLYSQKLTKDSWKIDTAGSKKVHIRYNYYAAELNAGSSYLDSSQLYVNPVNCMLYIPERIDEKSELELRIPDDYNVAIGKDPVSKNTYLFDSFHELADSPFIASSSLQHHVFDCERIEFNLWFQGECKPDWKKLQADFQKFCKHQLEMMRSFPVKKYHFLFQIVPHRFYHGVEHVTTTVIALGPGYALMKGDLYENLLGVSSHELFHVWNVKTIRPIEMMPYDYTKENYSKLGYVCEGLTTYYGDYLLFRSGVFNELQYFKTFNERLQKHFDNAGRFNMSVADSSFDTWLDGYAPGIPNRKTNIYDEGNLLAFVTDMFIRKKSGNKYSLDDVMLHLNDNFAKKGRGYAGADYKAAVEQFASASYDDIFNNYINGINDYQPLLSEAMEYIGCKLLLVPSVKYHERELGFKVTDAAGVVKISAVYPGSVSEHAGIAVGDELVAVENMQIRADGSGTGATEWLGYFGDKKLNITVSTMGVLRQLILETSGDIYFRTAQIKKSEKATTQQKINFELWSMNKF